LLQPLKYLDHRSPPDDTPRQGKDIVIVAPAAALNDHSANGLEATLDPPENCLAVFDRVAG
jgi:hypothetical protein